MTNDPEQTGALGKLLNDMTPSELLSEAHWAHRLIEAYSNGEFDCGGCGRLTGNTVCTGCLHGTSPIKLLESENARLRALIGSNE